MKVTPYSKERENYLLADEIIDYEKKEILQLSDMLYEKAEDELSYIQLAYEYVKNQIAYSADINRDDVPCTASEVLKEGHGVCFPKSHLLAALLRCKSIPAGFCYQKITLKEEPIPVLAYHGLNGVYIESEDKWIRLDAGGNAEDNAEDNAKFSLDTEQLVFTIRPEKGEEDSFVIYSEPDKNVIEKLRSNKSRKELMENPPTELANRDFYG